MLEVYLGEWSIPGVYTQVVYPGWWVGSLPPPSLLYYRGLCGFPLFSHPLLIRCSSLFSSLLTHPRVALCAELSITSQPLGYSRLIFHFLPKQE